MSHVPHWVAARRSGVPTSLFCRWLLQTLTAALVGCLVIVHKGAKDIAKLLPIATVISALE